MLPQMKHFFRNNYVLYNVGKLRASIVTGHFVKRARRHRRLGKRKFRPYIPNHRIAKCGPELMRLMALSHRAWRLVGD